MPDAGIRDLRTVIVPVTDQERSIDFYVNALGLELRSDTPFPGGRWVEVAPPESRTVIAVAVPGNDQPVVPQPTGIALTTEDIDATHQALRSAGVDVDAEVLRMGAPVPDMFWLRDPDGHSLMVIQPLES